ncbi:hypothetical protein T10_1038 [Trichinella papuae]|uniref:Uncharacterized protein n=1 Tax=Trichinella papuae TaxID=268474 RepID=A0A0V1M794_9BILA|nr:hypothetical protein T10_1038 [Trichinella papuae]
MNRNITKLRSFYKKRDLSKKRTKQSLLHELLAMTQAPYCVLRVELVEKVIEIGVKPEIFVCFIIKSARKTQALLCLEVNMRLEINDLPPTVITHQCDAVSVCLQSFIYRLTFELLSNSVHKANCCHLKTDQTTPDRRTVVKIVRTKKVKQLPTIL